MAGLISAQNARLLNVAAGAGLVARNTGIVNGAFALPPLTVQTALNVYGPAVYTAGAAATQLKLPAEEIVLPALLALAAFDTLVTKAQRDFSLDTILAGWLPAAAVGMAVLRR